MSDPANYIATELVRDGRRIEIRALRPADRDGLLAAVQRVGADSLYRRFFGVKREFSEQEIEFFSHVDFVTHVALVAVIEEAGQPTIIAGGRYIVTKPEQAEIAFVVVDAYQGLGIGSALLRHLAGIARANGLKRFVAEVLPDNTSMLKVFQKSGLECRTSRDAHAVHLVMALS